MSNVNRRQFLRNSAVLAGTSAIASDFHQIESAAAAADESPESFRSHWASHFDRVWLGPEYWANPLQDWRIADGKLECIKDAFDRNVQLLTRELAKHDGTLQLTVQIGRVGGQLLAQGKGSAGFRVGIMGPLREYRNSLIFGKGLDAGLTANGGLFIGDISAAKPGSVDMDRESLKLRLTAEPVDNQYTLTLTAHDSATGAELGRVVRQKIDAGQLVGNIALVANFGNPNARRRANRQSNTGIPSPGAGRFWFADWTVAGTKISVDEDRAFGPILFSQYTLSDRVLKLTAQMPPIGPKESQQVDLQVRLLDGNKWTTISQADIHPESRTATFRIPDWNDQSDVPYRLAYKQLAKDGGSTEHYYWTGLIRRDPVDQDVLTVADVSCNFQAAFPNADYVAHMAKLDPDLLAFVGDQFYESSGGYGVTRQPLDLAILDYLRKWYMHGWTWQELLRDRPSIALPDDHDVYQGNIWGEAGAPKQETQEQGGYGMDPIWVNVVHRTQTSHHPDPFDAAPIIQQGITVYHGPMTYGRVSFAVLADRMFKTGPEGVVPPTNGRGDHVTDPNFDPRTADVAGAELLGERQMQFLREWVADWRGADMKAVISQTIFAGMATTHGSQRERLIADYDANGWPQTPRNEALRVIRKAFAVHLAGDQHLPAVVHYGIDEHGDAPVAFAGPAVNVGYPRWFEPTEPGQNRADGAPENTGEFRDSFGHPLTVLAVANGAIKPRGPVLNLMQEKSSGLGIVRFNKAKQTITISCWPYLTDPVDPNAAQMPGWPVTITVRDNYGRKPTAYLPTLEVTGIENPVVHVIDESDGELVYALRVRGQQFQPHVFSAGRYTVTVSDPDRKKSTTLTGLEATPQNDEALEVRL